MATADKLDYLLETKNQIKNAIVEKGVSVTDADSFRSYASKIGQIEGGTPTDDWKPEPDWWDIEAILENDTEEYSQKMICLLTDELDGGASVMNIMGSQKYKLSDGQVFEQDPSTNLNIANLFDKSKDKVCKKGYKTRYIICYSNNNIIISLPNNAIYTILNNACFTGGFSQKKYLQAVKFINSKPLNSYCVAMFQNCTSLQKVEGLDLSNVTNISAMFSNCRSLKRVPILDTSNAINMSIMFDSCFSLVEVEGVDTSNATNIDRIFASCYSLRKVGTLNTQMVETMSTPFSTDYVLTEIEQITKIISNLNLQNSPLLSHKTLVMLLNALIDCSNTDTRTFQIGTDNLAKLTDEEKAIAINKNWTLA